MVRSIVKGLEFALSHEQRDENLEQWQSERTTAFPEPNVEVTGWLVLLLSILCPAASIGSCRHLCVTKPIFHIWEKCCEVVKLGVHAPMNLRSESIIPYIRW